MDTSFLFRLALGLVFNFAAGPTGAASPVVVAWFSFLHRVLLVAAAVVELGISVYS